MHKSKRSTGDPYLASQTIHRLYSDMKMGKRRPKKVTYKLEEKASQIDDRTQESSEVLDDNCTNNDLFDDQLSRDIALAVATIVAESELYHEQQEQVSPPQSEAFSILTPTSSSSATSPHVVGSPLSSKNSDKLVPSKNDSLASVIKSGSDSISTAPKGPTPPTPSRIAKMGGFLELSKYLGRVQNFMNTLGYHREGEPEIRINPRLSMKMQMTTAKELIRIGLPIKCLHAVVLAVYFTNCTETVERFPIYFRSHISGKEYKHIVLGIYVQGHFGALGISRDGGLQDKKIAYSKLSELVSEYANCYSESGHILNEVKFGNIITHDANSLQKLFSKIGTIPILGNTPSDIESNVERISKQLRAKMGLACIKATKYDPYQMSTPLTRMSRSKTSLNGSNNELVRPPRSFSIGPSSRNSDEANINTVKAVTRSKPPKLRK